MLTTVNILNILILQLAVRLVYRYISFSLHIIIVYLPPEKFIDSDHIWH